MIKTCDDDDNCKKTRKNKIGRLKDNKLGKCRLCQTADNSF